MRSVGTITIANPPGGTTASDLGIVGAVFLGELSGKEIEIGLADGGLQAGQAFQVDALADAHEPALAILGVEHIWYRVDNDP